MFKTVCDHGIFRNLAYSEPEAHSQPFQAPTMEWFAKIVDDFNYFCKLQLLLQYQLLIFSTL